jgi:hypothetical protein
VQHRKPLKHPKKITKITVFMTINIQTQNMDQNQEVYGTDTMSTVGRIFFHL